jgi:hypothetical protein
MRTTGPSKSSTSIGASTPVTRVPKSLSSADVQLWRKIVKSALLDLLQPERRDDAVTFLTSDDISWLYPHIGMNRKAVLRLAHGMIHRNANVPALKEMIRFLA